MVNVLVDLFFVEVFWEVLELIFGLFYFKWGKVKLMIIVFVLINFFDVVEDDGFEDLEMVCS